MDKTTQPPSGGCVLKLEKSKKALEQQLQPPSGGCVLKQQFEEAKALIEEQPPSGGCVLKLADQEKLKAMFDAATFGWLCVETSHIAENVVLTTGSHLRVAVC